MMTPFCGLRNRGWGSRQDFLKVTQLLRSRGQTEILVSRLPLGAPPPIASLKLGNHSSSLSYLVKC